MLVKTKNKKFEARTFDGLSVYMGLRFRKPEPAILFGKGKRVDIDMFFCFWPLEIYWIKNNIIQKKILAKPFRIYGGVKADHILETPVGFVKLKEGDKIEIK